MGVEIQRYLLPIDRSWRPDQQTLSRLVERLAAERWIPLEPWNESVRTPTGVYPLDQPLAHSLGRWSDGDFLLSWGVEACGHCNVRFPLVRAPGAAEEAYFELRVTWSTDHAYRTSEAVEPFADELLACSCGQGLEYWPEYDDPIRAARIRSNCPRCGRAIDVSGWPAKVIDGWTNKGRIVPGGATSRFAVVADVGKCWPNSPEERCVHPDLVACCSSALGVRFLEIEDLA